MRIPLNLSVLLIFLGCTTPGVRQVDIDSWVGQPVISLETHPIFLTIPVVKTTASNGTEIWNYINGADIGTCIDKGSRTSAFLNFATYSKFSQCINRHAACNNIFYIKNNIIQKYTPIGTGGVRCYTNETVQPNFNGTTNIN